MISILSPLMINNLSWNMRGIGNSESHKRLRRLIVDNNVKVVCVVEPMNGMDKLVR